MTQEKASVLLDELEAIYIIIRDIKYYININDPDITDTKKIKVIIGRLKLA